MKAGGAWIGIVVIAVVCLGFIGWYVNGLNKIVRLHESVNEKWAQVETMLQRRNDLIPNLVETTKGYTAQTIEGRTKELRPFLLWCSAHNLARPGEIRADRMAGHAQRVG